MKRHINCPRFTSALQMFNVSPIGDTTNDCRLSMLSLLLQVFGHDYRMAYGTDGGRSDQPSLSAGWRSSSFPLGCLPILEWYPTRTLDRPCRKEQLTNVTLASAIVRPKALQLVSVRVHQGLGCMPSPHVAGPERPETTHHRSSGVWIQGHAGMSLDRTGVPSPHLLCHQQGSHRTFVVQR